MNTNLLAALKEAGVRSREYAKPPFGDSVFGMTIKSDHPKGTVLIYQGTAKVEAHPDRKLRQCAVTVNEGNRVIERKVKTRVYRNADQSAPTREDAIHELKKHFPVIMPNGTRWSNRGLKITKLKRAEASNGYRLEATIIATVKNKTTNHFLIGMDETRNFICPLPEKPESVQHARDMLRPDEAKAEGTKRQGEWFFVPVVDGDLISLLRHKDRHDGAQKLRLGNTQHTAKKAVIINSIVYAYGYVIDQRVGHHKPTFLKGWHKVVKNKESTLRVSAVQKDALRTRTRSWD